MTTKPGADTLISKYIELRNIVSAADKKHKEATQQYKDAIDKIGLAIGKMLNDAGVESFKTKAGTAFKAEKDFVSVSDWQLVLDYAKKTGDMEMFNKAVKKDYAKAYMQDHEGNQLPGTEYGKKIEVQVRAPTK
jgi:hypothetical protein